jgi:hypothetical protein
VKALLFVLVVLIGTDFTLNHGEETFRVIAAAKSFAGSAEQAAGESILTH